MPEPPLQEVRLLRSAADVGLCPSRLHAARRAVLRRSAARRRDARSRSRGCLARSTWRHERTLSPAICRSTSRSSGCRASRTGSSACPSPNRPNSTRSPSTSRGRTRRVAAFSQYLLRDDPLGGPPGASARGGVVGFQTGLEYVNGKPKPLFFGLPVQLTVSRRGHGFSLWGLVRPTNGRYEADGARPRQALKALSHAEDGDDQQRRILGVELLDAGRLVARSLEQPVRQALRRSSHRGLLSGGRRRDRSPALATAAGRLAASPYDDGRCRSCPRLRSQLVCSTRRCAAGGSTRRLRRESMP